MEDERNLDKRINAERRVKVTGRRAGLDRHRGPDKRRSESRKAAEDEQISDEQFEFIIAIDEYKKKNGRHFPTWTEVLELIKALGYRKVAEPQSLETVLTDPSKEQSVDI